MIFTYGPRGHHSCLGGNHPRLVFQGWAVKCSHCWQLAREPRFVRFWWWTGSTALSGLKVHVHSKILRPFTTSARTIRSKVFLANQSSRNFNLVKRSTRFIMSSKNALTFHHKCTRCRPFLAPISFLCRRRHTFSCLCLNENHELSRSHSRQIDLCRQGLHSCDLLPCRLRSRVAGVAYQWIYMHQLLLPKLVKVTLGGIFVKEFCYTSGNHGSIWANCCSPSKTAKLLQISIGLPERASKNM